MSVTRRIFFRATGMGALATPLLWASNSVNASAAQGRPPASQKPNRDRLGNERGRTVVSMADDWTVVFA